MVPAKGGPKFSWHRRRRSKILAVSLKHWKGRRGGGVTGVQEPPPPLLRCTAVLVHHWKCLCQAPWRRLVECCRRAGDGDGDGALGLPRAGVGGRHPPPPLSHPCVTNTHAHALAGSSPLPKRGRYGDGNGDGDADGEWVRHGDGVEVGPATGLAMGMRMGTGMDTMRRGGGATRERCASL